MSTKAKMWTRFLRVPRRLRLKSHLFSANLHVIASVVVADSKKCLQHIADSRFLWVSLCKTSKVFPTFMFCYCFCCSVYSPSMPARYPHFAHHYTSFFARHSILNSANCFIPSHGYCCEQQSRHKSFSEYIISN